MASRPNFRRAYFDCRYGQLHCANAFPSTGGFDEKVALVCLHDVPGSSRELAVLSADLGRDRSVYAPDLPGCGMSDAPPAPGTISDYGLAVGDMLAGLRLRRFSLLGVGIGAVVAAEIASSRRESLDKLVLIAPPWLTEERPAAAPVPPRDDGGHLLEEWSRPTAKGPTALARTARLGDRLKSGPAGYWPAAALANWPARERLLQVQGGALLVSSAERPATGAALVPRAELRTFASLSAATLESPPEPLLAALRRYLDA